MKAVQAPSAPTRVTESPKAVANDALMQLVGLHGSISAPASKVLYPVSTTTHAVGRMLVLLDCRSDAKVVGGAADLEVDLAGGESSLDGSERDFGREVWRDPPRWRSVWWPFPHTRHLSPLRHERPVCW
ncbi:uncharacterized protein DMAD_00004 [Drosophila madeirensis]|uniref:Uncharacterized protein n=1 Tax=Drosophila madeirensis TaxID=30013 RepID=A0AAU9FUT4_DROMD